MYYKSHVSIDLQCAATAEGSTTWWAETAAPSDAGTTICGREEDDWPREEVCRPSDRFTQEATGRCRHQRVAVATEASASSDRGSDCGSVGSEEDHDSGSCYETAEAAAATKSADQAAASSAFEHASEFWVDAKSCKRRGMSFIYLIILFWHTLEYFKLEVYGIYLLKRMIQSFNVHSAPGFHISPRRGCNCHNSVNCCSILISFLSLEHTLLH